MKESFLTGLISGLCAPALAIVPNKISTKIDDWVLESSYRPPETDAKNLRQDFEKALGYAREEIKTAKKERGS